MCCSSSYVSTPQTLHTLGVMSLGLTDHEHRIGLLPQDAPPDEVL